MTRFERLLAGVLRPGIFLLDSRIPISLIQDAVTWQESQYFFIDGYAGAEITSSLEFLKAFAERMDFPGYFGQNWDAFSEFLRDLHWMERKPKIVIVLKKYGTFASHDTEAFRMAIDCFYSAIDHWWSKGTNFQVLLVFDERLTDFNRWTPLIEKPWFIKTM